MIKTQRSPGQLFRHAAALALMLLVSTGLYARQPISAPLNGSSELPAVTSSAAGTAQITVLPSRKVSGEAGLSEAPYASYLAGGLYVNVHGAQSPDGEIRAQLMGKPMRLAN
jgi:hypothetical protein